MSAGIALKCDMITFFYIVCNNALSFGLHSKQIIETSEGVSILVVVPILVYLSSISD